MFNYGLLADRVENGEVISADDAMEILTSPDTDLMELVSATSRLRRKYFGNQVKVNYLVNLKSGLCPEDCGYCSQRLGSDTEILKYSWLDADEARRQAEFGLAGGASRVCLVASGRGPSNRDINKVSGMVEDIKSANPGVEVCACLGFLKDGQAERLKEAGVDAYNHNLNTAESHYGNICTTHTFADRVDTVGKARNAGLSPCSGLIVGMGETNEQIVETIESLRDVDSDSIPVNFLIPFEGTPLAGTNYLTPQQCMRILCAVRFMCPDRELRIAGGREMHLRSLQPLSLHVANSLFLGDYLTSEGQPAEEDLDMIVDGGFSIVGTEDAQQLRDELKAHRAAHLAAVSTDPQPAQKVNESVATAASGSLPCGKPRPTVTGHETDPDGVLIPSIRLRGAGTDYAPNA
ncbi:biotin synthase BioB [Auritidibacter ignavus]|uniref:biotin synthase BioB n=1 Tax=Auritidibacter ignavus TaxID=678932 RepID=UPI002446C6A6|nr:biotin synthase BioB [Auritidibacter ignavus]WGH87110.1 biotin synthase BioB [Auritidibacter ignavus]WGH89394.1 biotin synthase BioB [Auritidibacter ignavus]